MKKIFSTAWKASKQPRKQRKYVMKAPLHIKRKLLSSSLSKELRKKYGRRSIELRKGDTVKVLNGKFKGKQGKIIQTFTKKSKATIENIQVKKQDGSKANVKIWASNLQIVELDLSDKKRGLEIKENKNMKSEEKIK